MAAPVTTIMREPRYYIYINDLLLSYHYISSRDFSFQMPLFCTLKHFESRVTCFGTWPLSNIFYRQTFVYIINDIINYLKILYKFVNILKKVSTAEKQVFFVRSQILYRRHFRVLLTTIKLTFLTQAAICHHSPSGQCCGGAGEEDFQNQGFYVFFCIDNYTDTLL